MMGTISGWVDERPDITLSSLCTKPASEHMINVSQKAMSAALNRMDFTVKILRAIPISRNCSEVIQVRKDHAQEFLNNSPADRRNSIWVDETGFNLYLRHKYGRARKGGRAIVMVTNNRGCNISVCAAMSEEGFIHEHLRPGSYNTESFCVLKSSL